MFCEKADKKRPPTQRQQAALRARGHTEVEIDKLVRAKAWPVAESLLTRYVEQDWLSEMTKKFQANRRFDASVAKVDAPIPVTVPPVARPRFKTTRKKFFS